MKDASSVPLASIYSRRFVIGIPEIIPIKVQFSVLIAMVVVVAVIQDE